MPGPFVSFVVRLIFFNSTEGAGATSAVQGD
jgi:hypothetical protein